MARIYRSWLVAALALGVGLSACKKDEKKEGGTTATATGEKSAEKAAEKIDSPAVAATKAMAGGDDLSLLPVDSDVVMGLNFASLQKSALWKKFVEPMLLKPDVQKNLAEFKDKCGFDPMTSMQSISMGLKNVGKSDVPDGVIVVHGLEKAKMTACITKMKAEIEKEGTTITDDGGVLVFKGKDGSTAALLHPSDTTALIVVGANANANGAKAAASGNSALKTSPAFVDMYSKINTKDSLWVLMNGNSPLFEKAAALGVKPKAVFGSVNVTDGLTLDMRVRLNTPDEAANLANMLKGQAGQAAQMFDKMDIGSDGADMKVSVAMSTAKLEKLVGQLMQLAGGMGGGMP